MKGVTLRSNVYPIISKNWKLRCLFNSMRSTKVQIKAFHLNKRPPSSDASKKTLSYSVPQKFWSLCMDNINSAHYIYASSINSLPSNNSEHQRKIISLSCGAGCGFSLFCFSIRNLVFVADIFIALMAGNNMKRMQTEVESIKRNI